MTDTHVYYVPMSAREKHIEDDINNAIKKLEDAYHPTLVWNVNGCIAPDNNKFMLIYSLGESEDSDSIGVRVIKGSQNMKTTQNLLNETLKELAEDEEEPKEFVNIFHPSEFIYIILYKLKAGNFPRVKIVPNPVSSSQGSVITTYILSTLEAKELDSDWEEASLKKVDILNDNNMIIYFETT